MRLFIATILFALSLTPLASGQVKFSEDLSSSQELAKKDGKLVFLYLVSRDSDDGKKMQSIFDTNKKLGDTLGRKFVCAKLEAELPANRATLKRFDASKFPTFIVFDPDGRILAREEGYIEPDRFAMWMNAMVDLQIAIALLEKVDRTKPMLWVAALRKVGAIVSDRSYSLLIDALDGEENPDSVRKAAIEGLGKQRFGPEKLLSFLIHRNPILKSAATTTIKRQGKSATAALIVGLADEEPAMRVASWALLTSLVRDAKLTRSADFWRNGKPPDREKAVAALKEWHRGAKKE